MSLLWIIAERHYVVKNNLIITIQHGVRIFPQNHHRLLEVKPGSCILIIQNQTVG